MIRKITIAIGVATFALSLSACNTVRGVAADLDSAADEVDDAT